MIKMLPIKHKSYGFSRAAILFTRRTEESAFVIDLINVNNVFGFFFYFSYV